MVCLDFVIIGAEKSGTSLLVDLLRKSDSVSIPDREVRHFRNPFYPTREKLETYFTDEAGRLKGIKHPSYLGRPEVPERLKEHSRSLRLVAILRNPVDRAISAYLHYIRHGQIPLKHPNEGIPAVLRGTDEAPKYRDILEFGDYAKYLQMYLNYFAREQLLVLEYEEFIKSADEVARLFRFLDLQPAEMSMPLPVVNEGLYDWGACRRAYHSARARYLYDEADNIVGTRPEPSPVQIDIPNEQLQIDPHVFAMLEKQYHDQSERLSALRLLTPRNWAKR